ncbi:MAG TPA: metalloregulator ArsR/SmtB family transcription factor [Acidimicrobiales bacterium]|nr:metalloregulator ArsR/SmtB family transcription factor [Acidimicrobiales bacterium]
MAKRAATIDTAGPCRSTALVSPLDSVRADELARGFAALADPVRLRVLSILSTAPAGEVCVCEFVAPLGRSQPTVSHHLKILGDAGLVSGQRRGKWVWYSVNRTRLADLRAALQHVL